jgi:hypothetical protein
MVSFNDLPRLVKEWQIVIGMLGAVIVAAFSAGWALYLHDSAALEAQKVQSTAALEAEKTRSAEALEAEKTRTAAALEAEQTRRIEAQSPFLEKRLEVCVSAMEAARKLTDPTLSPDSPEWKENETRLWELRWGELEMVGDEGTREAARRVTYKITEVRDHPNGDRKELRWAVECLADELRLSLETSWGFSPSAVRQTELGENVATLPGGCTDSGLPPPVPEGMTPLGPDYNLQEQNGEATRGNRPNSQP